MNRREFLKASSILGLGCSFLPAGCWFNSKPVSQKKVLVLGIDGMDPNLLRLFVKRGEMPAFRQFMESFYFGPLQTTMPPQSPVAWLSFISGCRPGGHGLYDFIHREPDQGLSGLTFRVPSSNGQNSWRAINTHWHAELATVDPVTCRGIPI